MNRSRPSFRSFCLHRWVVLVLATGLSAALAQGCGGSVPPAGSPSPATSVPPGAASKSDKNETDLDAPASPPPPPPPPAPAEATPNAVAPPAMDRSEGPGAALRASRSDLDRAVRDLEASSSDCASACRALASMERATAHLCDLATERDDRRLCEDSRSKVSSARERIRASCGVCR